MDRAKARSMDWEQGRLSSLVSTEQIAKVVLALPQDERLALARRIVASIVAEDESDE